GMSWIFGMTGSLDYAAIQSALAQNAVNKVALFMAFVFILAGFGYKMVFVPFHMWSPDVYEGAPTPFTAFLSVASNASGAAIMIRFFFPGVSRMVTGGDWAFVSGVEWPQVLLFVSMITMTVGNLCALNQRNLKRMLAYSGIAHAGYMLMGLAVLNNDGLRAVLKQGGVFVILAVVAILNSVVSLYYYAKVVKTMFLDSPDPSDKSLAIGTNNFTLLIPLTALTIVLGIYFSPLVYYTGQSLHF